MARRLAGSKNLQRIVQVPPGRELVALAAEPDAVALSPDILYVMNASNQQQVLKVILPVGTTQEYGNVLVTALVTRRSVVEEHAALIKGMLTAIQQAVLEVNVRSPAVLDNASKRFNRGKALVVQALEAANDAGVFPPNIVVQRGHWNAAVNAYCESEGKRSDPKLKTLANAMCQSHQGCDPGCCRGAAHRATCV